MNTFSQFPLDIAIEAQKSYDSEKWPIAANSFGICMEYCSNIDIIKAKKSPLFVSKSHEKHLESIYAKNSKLLKEVEKLKASVWQEAVNTILKYMEP